MSERLQLQVMVENMYDFFQYYEFSSYCRVESKHSPVFDVKHRA